jgi:DHA2 family multidrug resistance protein-like MFS transporter
VYRHRVAGALPADLPDGARHAAHDTLGAAAQVAGELPGPAGGALLDAARVAFTDGFAVVAGVGAATMVLAAILATVLLRRVGTPVPEPTQELVTQS